MVKTKNLIQLIPTYRSLLSDVQRQRRYVRDFVEQDILMASRDNDGSLDEEDFQKIRGYYGFGVPAIVGEGFCTLRGSNMSSKERIANTYQGALTGLYDDFFDKTHINHSEILSMMSAPENYQAKTSLERLFIHFLTKVHHKLPDPAAFNHSFQQVYEAQVESGEQLSADISFDNIKEITLRKGGYSLLFYRSVFENPLSTEEETALFNVGALMQLGNDIFDVWKDAPQKIKTLVTDCDHIDEVRKVFDQQLSKSISLVKQSGFSDKNIRRYLNKLLLGISRCYVCLDQLEHLEKFSNGKFSPSAYSREQMLCDMEKPANMIRSIRYYLGYSL